MADLPIADAVLLSGLDDDVRFSDFLWHVCHTCDLDYWTADPSQLLEPSIATLRALLDENLVEVGELTDNGFVAWAERA
jgi:hypothetical protein